MTYEPVMTPGRELYERWLWARQVPPDDLWDHLDEDKRLSWEAISTPKAATVVHDWLSAVSWKQQSILFSGLRGPDVPNVPATKAVNRWMRTVTQYNADPSKQYMKSEPLPDPLALCDELEFLSCHYVHHLADALAVIAYGHPEEDIARQAALFHYTIAEELFHFKPEARWTFEMRHRDKPDGVDGQAARWGMVAAHAHGEYVGGALQRFEKGRR